MTISGTLAEKAENKWQAFVKAGDASGITIPGGAEFRYTAQRIFAFSDFVSETCIRHPDLLVDLVQSGDLERGYLADEYSKTLKALLAGIEEEAALEKRLRHFRRREMVRIAWRDLCGLSDLFVTMADLTALAEAVVDQTQAQLYHWQCTTHGVPTGTDGLPQELVVVGMGKLGGKELNFSSDIDLIFAYPQNGKTVGASMSISNEEFFMRLCRRLLQAIGKVTADGFVFRVDVRLRPFGDNGPLAMSFDAMEHYYQQQGREWERYAWIKARIVAGDKRAGEMLLQRLNPFVFRRYLDFGAFESLRDMKQRISLEVSRQETTDNIKLGRGGIREIEFFGQVFQLIRGGINPSLQERGILRILSILGEANTVPRTVSTALQNAYIFLRNLEHRLQEFSDKQTHRLPAVPSERQRLALSMGFEDSLEWQPSLRSSPIATSRVRARGVTGTAERDVATASDHRAQRIHHRIAVRSGLGELRREERHRDRCGLRHGSQEARDAFVLEVHVHLVSIADGEGEQPRDQARAPEVHEPAGRFGERGRPSGARARSREIARSSATLDEPQERDDPDRDRSVRGGDLPEASLGDTELADGEGGAAERQVGQAGALLRDVSELAAASGYVGAASAASSPASASSTTTTDAASAAGSRAAIAPRTAAAAWTTAPAGSPGRSGSTTGSLATSLASATKSSSSSGTSAVVARCSSSRERLSGPTPSRHATATSSRESTTRSAYATALSLGYCRRRARRGSAGGGRCAGGARR